MTTKLPTGVFNAFLDCLHVLAAVHPSERYKVVAALNRLEQSTEGGRVFSSDAEAWDAEAPENSADGSLRGTVARLMLADACNGALNGPSDSAWELDEYAEHIRDRTIAITEKVVELFGENLGVDPECGDAFDAIEAAVHSIENPCGSCCFEECQDDAEVRLGKQLFCKYHAADGLLSGLPNGERDTIARFHAGLPVVGDKP